DSGTTGSGSSSGTTDTGAGGSGAGLATTIAKTGPDSSDSGSSQPATTGDGSHVVAVDNAVDSAAGGVNTPTSVPPPTTPTSLVTPSTTIPDRPTRERASRPTPFWPWLGLPAGVVVLGGGWLAIRRLSSSTGSSFGRRV